MNEDLVYFSSFSMYELYVVAINFFP